MFTSPAIDDRADGCQIERIALCGRSEKDESKKKKGGGVSASIVESVQGVAIVLFKIRSWAIEREGKSESGNPAGGEVSEGQK
jgi:hypothetical protein